MVCTYTRYFPHEFTPSTVIGSFCAVCTRNSSDKIKSLPKGNKDHHGIRVHGTQTDVLQRCEWFQFLPETFSLRTCLACQP